MTVVRTSAVRAGAMRGGRQRRKGACTVHRALAGRPCDIGGCARFGARQQARGCVKGAIGPTDRETEGLRWRVVARGIWQTGVGVPVLCLCGWLGFEELRARASEPVWR